MTTAIHERVENQRASVYTRNVPAVSRYSKFLGDHSDRVTEWTTRELRSLMSADYFRWNAPYHSEYVAQHHGGLESVAMRTVERSKFDLMSGRKSNANGPIRLNGPVQFVSKLLEQWRLQRHEAGALLGFKLSDTPYVESVLDGFGEFRGRDVNDRIACLFQIRQILSSLFRSLEVENDWLREPHEMLDGRSPIALLLGTSMEELLLVRDYVDFAAGR